MASTKYRNVRVREDVYLEFQQYLGERSFMSVSGGITQSLKDAMRLDSYRGWRKTFLAPKAHDSTNDRGIDSLK